MNAQRPTSHSQSAGQTPGRKTGLLCQTACDSRAGQAMIETLLTVLVISVLFFGLFQLAQVFVAKEILQHASARAARARTVGFDRWMCRKSMLVASIPNAGQLITPDEDFENAFLQDLVENSTPGEVWDASLQSFPGSEMAQLELAEIPWFMGSGNEVRGRYILDYADWDTIHGSGLDGIALTHTITVGVRQRYPLFIDLRNWLFAPVETPRQHVILEGENTIETHYSLYLNDQNW